MKVLVGLQSRMTSSTGVMTRPIMAAETQSDRSLTHAPLNSDLASLWVLRGLKVLVII